ncbi:MAG TPA: TonB-dependent receptor [Gemmatimonadaceae bacterium]|nr:TonB-dependent receptor [Gemmatimonadaceae bacterium]
MRSQGRYFSAVLLMLLLAAPVAWAQETGMVEGTVRATGSGTPLSDVTVFVQGTTRGGVTDEQGRFRILAVPTGDRVVMAQLIGRARGTQTVHIAADSAVRVEFALTEVAAVIAPTVVSATREVQRRTDQSTTIDVLEGASIREVRAAHPSGIMQRLPGVHATQLSGEGLSMSIRQPITTKPMYLYLEDGVPTRSTGFFNHNALYEVNLPQSGGLEVLKGPGTAMYGSDAIGGVVNVLTRAAPVTPTMDATMEGGSYGYARLLATGGFTKGVNGVRADLNVTRSDGWRDDGGFTRQSATIRWDGAFGGFTTKTVLAGSNINQSEAGSLTQAQFDSREEINPSPIAYREVQALRLSTAIEKDNGRSLFSLTPYARHNVLDIMPSWQLTYNQQIWDTRNNSVGLLAKYRYDFAPMRTRVIVGADLDYSPGSFLANRIASTPDSGIYTSYTTGEKQYDYDVTYRQASPYLHTEFSPVSRLRLDAGLRYDMSGYVYDTKLDPIETGRWRRPADTTVNYTRLSPKVGATLDLTRNVNLYASYREGFRAPGQNQLFQQGSNAASTVGLKPVTAKSLEGGARGQVSGRFMYSVSVYDMHIQNDILTILDAQGAQTTSNAGETRHRGVELSAGAMLTHDLRLDAAYSSSKQNYVEWVIPVAGQNVSYAGKTIETAPHTLTNILLSYSPNVLNGGRFAVEWSKTGEYYGDPENTQMYHGFDLWALHGNYMVRNIGELFLRVTNLTNEKYAEVATYNAFNNWQYTPGTPRSVFLGLRYNWQK